MAFRGIEGAYLGALRAFKTPMLDLLHQTYAPFVVTMLASMFTADRPTVAVADAHAEISDALNQLRAAGYGEEGQLPLPTGSARELCRHWVNAGWLIRQAPETAEQWIGSVPQGSLMFPGVSIALLRNATLFGGFGSMYFAVTSMSDAEHRQRFFAPIIDDIERLLAVRAAYLAVRADIASP